ncbi:MAG TPA: LacI family DNA-binding transcriptional regulator [Roseiarcus sp.]|nr:LacI family DNA-binding transcriptional regulator [Roseiarcus sp.]
MSKGPATIRDVAKAAKVSAATVSRHLNKSIVLPQETARRIDKACARLAYRPNALAKRLSLGSAQTIGLVAPEIANPFFAALAAAAEAEARRQGYSLLIMSTGGDPDIECEHIDRLGSRAVDGLLVLTSSADDGRVRDQIDGRPNVVLVDEDVPGASVSRIFVENEQGAYEATRYLIDRGHAAIAHVGGPAGLLSSRERHAGFVRAMAEAGLSPLDSWVKFGGYDREAGLAAALDLLAQPQRPTALFAGSDYIAIGVLQGLRQLGLEAPAALSIVGFDDMPLAELLHPPLTTVRQPIAEMGRLGVQTLLARMRGESPQPGETRLPTQLVLRASVASLVAAPQAAHRTRPRHKLKAKGV